MRLALACTALAAAATAVGVGVWWFRPAGPALDEAPRELQVPDYFDPVFFQGQGYPVHTDHVRTGERTVDGARVFVLPHFAESIDYKNIQETPGQVAHVNATYAPEPAWRVNDERRMGHYKCISISTSMLLDWFALERGHSLEEYVSVLDGVTYRGFDPKALDSLYYLGNGEDEEVFKLTPEGHLDPITGVPVPYSVEGFARIVGRESASWKEGEPAREVRDYNLPLYYAYSFAPYGVLLPHRLVDSEIRWPVAAGVYPREESERLRRAMREHGPLLAGIKVRFAALHGVFDHTRIGDLPIVGLTGHGVVIVGWIEKDDRLYFLYRETFGRANRETPQSGPSYRIYPIYGFNEVFAFEAG